MAQVEVNEVDSSPSALRSNDQRIRAWGRAALRALQRRDLVFAVPFLGFALWLAFSPVLGHEGWPANHEALTWKYRLLIYVAHFRRFDLLPVWSESAAQGWGAPSPVLYHKLFYFLAAAFYLLTGSVKAAVVAALAGFSALGVIGQRALLCRLGVAPRPALVAAAALLFCNYSYTNWLVRGAFAEYAAMLLLPWLLRWLLGVLTGEAPRRLLWLGVVLFPALYLAHTSLFFFAAVPVLGAIAWRFARHPDRKAFLRALLVIGGAFALVAAPIVVCQLFVTRQLSFAEGIAVYLPQAGFSPLWVHLTGGGYVWGASWHGLSVQLDLTLVTIAAIVLGSMLWSRWRPAPSDGPSAPEALGASGRVGYIAAWAAVGYFAYLLTPASAPLYVHVPGFSTLQFPWRLLSFVSVLAVTLAAFPLLARLRWGNRDVNLHAAWLLLALTYVSSPWLHEVRYAWIPRDELEQELPASARLQVGGFEYHPRVAGVTGDALVELSTRAEPKPDEPSWSRPGYSVERLDEPAFEKGKRGYHVSSSEPTRVLLPIAYSPFIRVYAVDQGGTKTRLATYRQASEPRIQFDVPAGELNVLVRYPNVFSMYADILAGRVR